MPDADVAVAVHDLIAAEDRFAATKSSINA